MNEFEAIATQQVTEEFERLTEAMESLSADDRTRYNEKFSPRIMAVVMYVPLSAN